MLPLRTYFLKHTHFLYKVSVTMKRKRFIISSCLKLFPKSREQKKKFQNQIFRSSIFLSLYKSQTITVIRSMFFWTPSWVLSITREMISITRSNHGGKYEHPVTWDNTITFRASAFLSVTSSTRNYKTALILFCFVKTLKKKNIERTVGCFLTNQ